MRFGIGQLMARKEDPRLLTGRGRYVAYIRYVADVALVVSWRAQRGQKRRLGRLMDLPASGQGEVPAQTAYYTQVQPARTRAQLRAGPD